MSNMHQGLDLSRFKKVSSDKKSTTLRHSKGHEIRIAHSALTPKMKERLDCLEMAEGGEVEEPAAPLDPESPEPVSDPASNPDAPSPEGLQPDQPVPDQPAAQEAPAQAPAPASTTPAAAQHPATPASPDNTVDVFGARPQKTAAQRAQEMVDHDLQFQQDLAKGHIKPETYQSLYAKKDTLGKIGTLFGMMLSGAGSGLAHQPNAVMEMMNKTIQNDFEAQKASHESAHNWLRLSQAHEMQKAQIEQMAIQNALTKAQTGKVPYDIEHTKAQIQNLKGDMMLKSDAHTLNRMKMGAVQDLQDKVNKMPEGPAKASAQQNVNLLSQGVQAEVGATALQTADQIDARNKLRGDDNGVNLDRLNTLANSGRANDALGIPSKFTESDLSAAQKEAAEVADNRAIARIYDDSFKQLDKAFAAGTLNPQMRQAMVATLGAEVARATAGRFNAQEAASQADGMFPSAKDYGSARPEKYRKAMQYFRGKEASTVTLDRFGLKTPFPFADKAQHRHEGKTATGKNGEKMIMKDGKWVPVGKTKQATK